MWCPLIYGSRWTVGLQVFLFFFFLFFFSLHVSSIEPDLNWLPIKRCVYLTFVTPPPPPPPRPSPVKTLHLHLRPTNSSPPPPLTIHLSSAPQYLRFPSPLLHLRLLHPSASPCLHFAPSTTRPAFLPWPRRHRSRSSPPRILRSSQSITPCLNNADKLLSVFIQTASIIKHSPPFPPCPPPPAILQQGCGGRRRRRKRSREQEGEKVEGEVIRV